MARIGTLSIRKRGVTGSHDRWPTYFNFLLCHIVGIIRIEQVHVEAAGQQGVRMMCYGQIWDD